MVAPCSRGGVPVFIRLMRKPSRAMVAASPEAAVCAATSAPDSAASALGMRPAGRVVEPIWITPRRNVPVVITTASARTCSPDASTTPRTR